MSDVKLSTDAELAIRRFLTKALVGVLVTSAGLVVVLFKTVAWSTEVSARNAADKRMDLFLLEVNLRREGVLKMLSETQETIAEAKSGVQDMTAVLEKREKIENAINATEQDLAEHKATLEVLTADEASIRATLTQMTERAAVLKNVDRVAEVAWKELARDPGFQRYVAKGQLLVPGGTIVPFAGPVGDNPPEGWLPCDGRRLRKDNEVYGNLLGAIGTSWGGDEEYFFLPDLRGRFLRGVSGDSKEDPDVKDRAPCNPGGNPGNAVGSIQRDATRRPDDRPFTTDNRGRHSHTIPKGGGESDTGPWADSGERDRGLFTSSQCPDHSHTITGGGDAETRPKNAYVNWIIKY